MSCVIVKYITTVDSEELGPRHWFVYHNRTTDVAVHIRIQDQEQLDEYLEGYGSAPQRIPPPQTGTLSYYTDIRGAVLALLDIDIEEQRADFVLAVEPEIWYLNL